MDGQPAPLRLQTRKHSAVLIIQLPHSVSGTWTYELDLAQIDNLIDGLTKARESVRSREPLKGATEPD